ncbi:hypothetical protein IJX73_01150 [bacterium]|nr:hypothetical protein [bacterium]MBQ9149516.1 hypothetical protein [bacterium]
MSFDDFLAFQQEINRIEKEEEHKEALKNKANEDFGFGAVLEERQKKKENLRAQLLSLNLNDNDIDKLFQIITLAEEKMEQIKKEFDYKAKIPGSAEAMQKNLIDIQKKMKQDFDNEFEKIYRAKLKK